ncbi:MAG: diguanylate cyclase [Desulfobacteraceae bacterium]|nr:diguanylate cyclase [Desulfobacteraceae bacterium]
MKFPGYTITANIAETRHSAVYSAQQDESGRAVIIKAINTEISAPMEIARIRHEYDLIRGRDIRGVVNILDILDTRDHLALVMEDFGGVSLKDFLGRPLPLERFLDMGIRTAEILAALHHHDISHRDVKPGNIIYNSRTNTLKLSDFGIAAEVARGGEQIHTPEAIEATLAYMSPEQTGRMNCEVDYRTDFYSLGATFYEMLTGRPPFTAGEPMEIIHAHIARQPAPPSALNPEIPEAVSAIVIKLLAKGADQRYQSGQGLIADLAHCRSQLEATGQIQNFEPGRNDFSLKFTLPQVLVGRENEFDRLCRAFDRAADGAMEIMLVTGESGIGKSSLVFEMDKTVAARRGFFLSGKYDQLRRHVPYSALIQAFQAIARRLLAQSDAQIRQWREKLLAALSPNTRIITDIIPQIRIITGETEAVPELAPREARNRFQRVFKNFLQVFADSAHPLVLFLDDLQWADPASIELIQSIAADAAPGYFFFIGAFRDREVPAHHPLANALEKASQSGTSIETLRLGALDEVQTNRLLSGFLRCDPAASAPLAGVIHEKTLGNPFFVTRFLKSLYENKLLVPDPASGWRWDFEAIRQMQVTDNVVDFMAEKIRELPDASLELIKVCACVGNRFDAEVLAQILEKPIDEVIDIMEKLAADGFFVPKRHLYAFHHDRIQEAAYSLVPIQQREQNHYHIGRLVLSQTPEQELFNKVFYIADQLNQSLKLIHSGPERTMLAELNLKAGIKAKEATAYDTAANYLQTGTQLLPCDPWQARYRLTYELYTELMESSYLSRRFKEAESLFDVIIANAETRADKARAYTVMIVLYTNMRSPMDALKLGIQALGLFGVKVRINTRPERILAELLKVRRRLKKTSVDTIPDLPVDTDANRLAYHRLLIAMSTPAYYVNPNLFALVVLKGTNETLKHGLVNHSAATFISLATIFENAIGDYEMAYRMGEMALRLNEKLGERTVAGYVHHIFAFFIQHWKKHARHDVEIYRKVYPLCMDNGNFTFAGHGVNAATDCRLLIGDRLDELLEETKKYRDIIRQTKDPFIEARFLENIQMIKALKGLTKDRKNLSGEGFDQDAHLSALKAAKNLFGVCYALLYREKLLYLHGAFEEAGRCALELERYIRVPIGTLLVAEHSLYCALSMAAFLKNEKSNKKSKHRRLLRKHQRKLAKWARLCPENFRHKHELVRAEYLAVQGHFKQALACYHAAIEGARNNDYVNEEALACELTATFYRDHNAEEEALSFLERAYRCYGRWGAAAKQLDLEERFPQLPVRLQAKRRNSSGETTTLSEDTGSDKLDINTVMQVSHALSSQIVLDSLVKQIMQISVTNAGAQLGVLLLETNGKLTIEAVEDGQQEANPIAGAIPVEEYNALAKTVVNYVWRTHEAVILSDAAGKGAFTEDPHIAQNRCKSLLCIPILNKGELSGLLYMENNLVADAFTEERLALLGVIASQAAISLENARLFEQATTDGLTRLYVQRYFHFLLEKEIKRSRRYGRRFSLMFMDIDDFKHFNDTYGHQLGDEVLKKVAAVLQKNTRAVDIAARYGGEEFVLVLPETGAAQAATAAEKIRRLVADTEIMHENQSLRVTISLGLATFPEHATEKDALIKAADNALYASKHSGKNRVSITGPQTSQQTP